MEVKFDAFVTSTFQGGYLSAFCAPAALPPVKKSTVSTRSPKVTENRFRRGVKEKITVPAENLTSIVHPVGYTVTLLSQLSHLTDVFI